MAEILGTVGCGLPADGPTRTQHDTIQGEVLPIPAHCETTASHFSTDTIPRHRSLSESPRPNAKAISRIARQQEAFVTADTTETLARSELAAANRDWKETRKAYKKTLASYENAVDPFRKPTHTDIKALRKSLRGQQTTLELQASKVRKLQEQLKAAEASFKKNRIVFMAIVRETNLRPEHAPATDVGPSLASVSVKVAQQAAESPSPEIHPLLESYYASAARVNILGERLADYNYEYWSAVANREIRQDQDEILPQTEEEFEESWLHDRLSLTRELEEAIKEADRLKTACEEKKLDTSTARQNTPGTEGAIEARSDQEEAHDEFEAAISHIPAAAFDNAEVVRAESSDTDDTAPNVPRSLDSIERWVEDLGAPGVKTA